MKPMKIVRRKRQNESKIKYVLYGILALLVVAILVALVFLIRSCGSASEYVRTSIPVEETTKYCVVNDGEHVSMTVKAGDISILTVPEEISMADVEFKSSSEDILTVDSGGRVDALKEGSAVITITSSSYEGYCDYTVEKASESSSTGEVTTAITENESYLKENLKNGEYMPYLIQVNRKTNVVTVYTYDDLGKYQVPVRAMVCSCGLGDENITPAGEYTIEFKSRWTALFGDVYGQYISGFNGDILFHSVPYYTESADDLETEEFNKLGDNASQGCVRLSVSDAKWIYDNCDMNTIVRVIDQSEKADPLGKPVPVRIPSKPGWDPTDPDKKNPYLEKKPVISGVKDMEIKKGDAYSPSEGVTAVDTCGNDITADIKVVGNVVTEKAGTYYVTYIVKDGFGKEVKQTITVTVK